MTTLPRLGVIFATHPPIMLDASDLSRVESISCPPRTPTCTLSSLAQASIQALESVGTLANMDDIDLGYASDDALSLHSLNHEHDPADIPPVDRYEIFMPAIQNLVNALGGYEEVQTSPGVFETVYRPGDSVLGVLKDLKKLWRKDDSDDERTVARCMAKAGLMRELIAIVVECAERGDWGRKIALMACECTDDRGD